MKTQFKERQKNSEEVEAKAHFARQNSLEELIKVATCRLQFRRTSPRTRRLAALPGRLAAPEQLSGYNMSKGQDVVILIYRREMFDATPDN